MNLPAGDGRGFTDPVHESQKCFRAIMNALAHPAEPHPFMPPNSGCGALGAEAAAILLTLADFDTPVWLGGAGDCGEVREFIAFQCGAPIVADRAQAAFALIPESVSLAALESFSQGEPEYPDRAVTLIVQVECFGVGPWRFSGPGLRQPRSFSFAPAPDDFMALWQENSARFPLGVDILFVAQGLIAALPRSLIVQGN